MTFWKRWHGSLLLLLFFLTYFTPSLRLNNRPVELVKLSGFRPRLDIKVSNPPKVRYHQSVSNGKAQYIFLMCKKNYRPEFQVFSGFCWEKKTVWSEVKKKESHLGGEWRESLMMQMHKLGGPKHPSKEKHPRCCKVWWNTAGKRRMKHIQLSCNFPSSSASVGHTGRVAACDWRRGWGAAFTFVNSHHVFHNVATCKVFPSLKWKRFSFFAWVRSHF